MGDLRDLIPQEQRAGGQQNFPVWHGVISRSPIDQSDQLYVVIPDLSPDFEWGPCQWQSRNNTDLPLKGMECLVHFNNREVPWVAAYWPFVRQATDPDATAFLTAAGITSVPLVAATTALVIGLKNNALWGLMHGLWPFIGGSAATHKYNLKDPRDLDAAFRLSFSGTWVHSANGVDPDGSTAYANTHLDPSVILSSTSGSMGIYVRENTLAGTQDYDMGASDASDLGYTGVISRYNSGEAFGAYGTSTYNCHYTNADARGFYVANRRGAVNTEVYEGGALMFSQADSVVLKPYPLFVGATNYGNTGALYFSNRQLALTFVADGLTAGQVATLNTLVQTFQTSLGREV